VKLFFAILDPRVEIQT